MVGIAYHTFHFQLQFTMKFFAKPLIILLTFISFVACQQKQALYNEVMEVHDEVMPKLNDLYKAKTSLQTRLAMPGLGESEKAEINNKIARIDSASEGMMVWMRQFNPPADSSEIEEARTYLESELVKVKKVRQDILEALAAAQ
ncbi:MAG TPA: hypothetical protein VIQ51_03395 [Chryseosolibacter sp.]